jgi:hypothetical protein
LAWRTDLVGFGFRWPTTSMYGGGFELGIADFGADLVGAGVEGGAHAGIGAGAKTRAKSSLFSEMGSTRTCSGASQVGKWPAKCSMSTPVKRSMLPKGARWIMTGRCGLVVGADVAQLESLGRL